MLSIGKLGIGQERYYLDKVAEGAEDYYSGEGETAGEWIGDAADRLGLDGEVTAIPTRVVPDEVEEPYATDFREAAATLHVSPKASAALSRRLLQHLLREKAGIQHSEA